MTGNTEPANVEGSGVIAVRGLDPPGDPAILTGGGTDQDTSSDSHPDPLSDTMDQQIFIPVRTIPLFGRQGYSVGMR